jgi:hypothetical protein
LDIIGPPPVMSNVMLRSLALVFAVLIAGCANPQTVSHAQLEHLKTQRREPKVSAWYYLGSKDGFHYFHHEDLGSAKKDFRISETELSWQDTFPLTRDRSSWRSLDWGVYERR